MYKNDVIVLDLLSVELQYYIDLHIFRNYDI